VDRESHGAPAVGDPTGDGLADPPCGVGRELEPSTPAAFLNRVDQPQVALLHQVQQWKFGSPILAGDRDHQSQVGGDETVGRRVALTDQAAQLPLTRQGDPFCGQFASGLLAGLDGLSQPDLVVLGEQAMFADVIEVERDEVLFGLRGSLAGQPSSSLDLPGAALATGAPGHRPAKRPAYPSQPNWPVAGEQPVKLVSAVGNVSPPVAARPHG
jgi:hypothetical protein